jgi:hypothetical protein
MALCLMRTGLQVVRWELRKWKSDNDFFSWAPNKAKKCARKRENSAHDSGIRAAGDSCVHGGRGRG